ncbi:hypothetical protein B0O99DRAFT_346833 [Bisporella sp. PMI_857]|nr:hypothetical protein B0O99DRAFT_346833 [Bisporella sp. PMI_857]
MSKETSPDHVPPSTGHPLAVVLYPTSFAGVIILTVTQLLLYVILLGFTPPRSLLRPAALPLLTFLLWNLYQTCYLGVPLDILNAMIGGFASGWWVQYIVSALILQEHYPTAPSSAPQNAVPERSPAKKGTFWNRTWYGLKKINSQRNLGTEKEAKKIPHFSTSDPSYVPSRRAFLVQKGAAIITCYLLLDLLTLNPPDVSSNATTFSAEKVRLLSRITELSGEEVKTRAMASIGQWVASYIFLTMAHSVLAFATVLLRFYEPRDWRPLFGSITELYSVRRFWGYVFVSFFLPFNPLL